MAATTTEGKISEALKARTVALATSLQYPLEWDGWNFTPPDDKKYLSASHQPNFTNRMMIGSTGQHRYVGLLMIRVFHPHGGGEPALRDTAGEVIAYFPCDMKLRRDTVTVRITKRPEAAGLMVDDADMHIPVMIEYEAYA